MLYLTGLVVILCSCSTWARPQQPQQAPQQQQQQQQHQQQQQQPSNGQTTPIPIVSQTESSDGNGSFVNSFETGNGIHVSQQGFLKQIPVAQLQSRGQFGDQDPNSPNDGLVQVQTGSYSYTAPDGTIISLNYTADETGFHPFGDHLPTPPPVPDYVAQLLTNIANDPQQQQQQQQPQQQQQQQPQQQQQHQPLAGAQSVQDVVAVQNPEYPQQFEEDDDNSNVFLIRTFE